ncbi:hypothetical protein [Nocardia pseudovaccinii]|uniref:hypothetical protein n=1 Tax=Nocardia pseudovaccinii TaxID=189540 RepID=UPI0007A44BCB|nr:hypothetical protein [Nocardia pseudovaccinii]
MTSDLPFDSDATDADDRAGDTAYRVATGVARVARAGAYVTGGALVAANGGTAPVHPGGQRLDSWTSAYTRDPDADAPSPVVTFPDPDPNSTPPAPLHSSTPTPRDVSVNAPFTIPNVPNSGVYIGPVPQQHSPQPWQNTGYGSYQPGLALGTESERSGLDLHSDSPQSGLDLGTGHVPGLGNVPGLDLGQGGHGFNLPSPNLPSPNGFLAPGSNPFTLPRVPTSGTAISESVSSDAESADDGDAVASNVPFYGGNMFHSGATGGSGELFHGNDVFHGGDAFHGADMYHGVGSPDAFGVFINAEAGFSVHTELQVDFSAGPNGVYLATQSKIEVEGALKVEVGAGRVGDNIDRYSDWLGQTPGTTGRTGLDNAGTNGTVNPVGTQPVGGSVPQYSAVQPVAVQPVQPFAAPLPAPVAAVAPAAVAPAVVAPAAVAAPVAATPLQTTIQPDVASTPVANVLVAPAGPSPLTAPAATVPALFEPRPVPAKHPVVVDDSPSTTTPLTNIPTTVTKTVPIPADNTTGHPTKTPDTGSTKPGHPTVPDTDATGTTKIPTATHAPTTQAPTTHTPTHTATPTIPDDDDVTIPSTGNSGGTSTGHNGGTIPSTVNGGNSIPNTHTTQPDIDDPTVDVPTVSVPTMTHSAPTVAPTPDIDIPTANSPAPIPTQQPHVPAPTMPAPVTPMKPPAHPIAADLGDPADFAHPVYEPDHTALTLMAAGLSTPLLPDPGVDDGHHVVAGLDINLF